MAQARRGAVGHRGRAGMSCGKTLGSALVHNEKEPPIIEVVDLERQLAEAHGKLEATRKAVRTYTLMANTPASQKLSAELDRIKEGNE